MAGVVGYTHGGGDLTRGTLFDGVTFDPQDPETYAARFAGKNLEG